MELSKKQKEAVETKYDKVVVISTAASGKTRVLTERVKYLLNEGVDPARIVVITFTNAAAEEMKKRVGEAPVFIGTIHSYANQILSMYGVNTKTCIARKDFDGLFELIKENPDAVQEVDHLLLDEAQDSGDSQFEFLLDVIRPKNFFFVGDFRQCIYEFNGAHPELLVELSEAPGVKTYNLNENYRNASKILTFAKSFINKLGSEYTDYSYPMRDNNGIVVRIEYDPETIAHLILKKGDYKNWFVLTRTNAELEAILNYLVSKGIPCDTFKRGSINEEEFLDKMSQDTVKVLTIHSCVPGNTLVQTSNGIKTIKEIVEQSDYSELVYDGEKYAKVKSFIDNGKERVYKITTKYGNTIEVTRNHEVCILTENGIEKRKAFELKGNEELLLCKDIPNTTHKVPLEKLNKTELDVRTVIYQEPDYLTEELAELIGLITADGSYNASSIHYTKRYKECCDRFAELIYKIFGKHLEVRRNPRGDDSYVCECNSKFILNFLKLNFDGITPCNKFVSSKILEGDKNIYRAFLRGLFEDGTVHMKKQRFDHICLTFKNDKMKEQLQTMLFNLGIDCVFKKYESQKNINNLQIYAGGGEKFKEIGFISPIKQENLEKCQQKYKRKNKSKSLCQLILQYKDRLRFKKNQFSNLLRDETITEYSMEQLVLNNEVAFREDPKLHMAGQIFARYQVEQIADITLSEEEVDTYCLEMEDKHEFIQNGFLMGNSKGLEAENVVVIGARGWNEEEKRIQYVAATRAKDVLIWTTPRPKKKRHYVDWE